MGAITPANKKRIQRSAHGTKVKGSYSLCTQRLIRFDSRQRQVLTPLFPETWFYRLGSLESIILSHHPVDLWRRSYF